MRIDTVAGPVRAVLRNKLTREPYPFYKCTKRQRMAMYCNDDNERERLRSFCDSNEAIARAKARINALEPRDSRGRWISTKRARPFLIVLASGTKLHGIARKAESLRRSFHVDEVREIRTHHLSPIDTARGYR